MLAVAGSVETTEYSDRPFAEKRDMRGGFRESPLKLNAGLGQLESWDEAAIRSRAARLAMQAAGVWSTPTLAEATLDGYRPPREPLWTGATKTDRSSKVSGSAGGGSGLSFEGGRGYLAER